MNQIDYVSPIARERKAKRAQWLRFTVFFEPGALPLASTP